MNQEKIGKFLSEKRKEKNLTQQELAEKLGVTNRTISKWETGRYLPDYSLVNDICKELDITINELFQGKDIDEESYTKEKKEKTRKRRIKKLIKTLIIITIIYILYKWFLLLYYGTRVVSDGDIEKTFPYNKNISTISVENNVMYNKTYGYNNDLRVFIPEDFELITDKAKTRMVSDAYDLYIKNYKTSEEFDAFIMIGRANNMDIYNLDYYGIDSTLFPFMDVYSVLKKYDIEDQFDLYKYYEKNYKYKENIFTNTKRIQMNYIAKTYSNLTASTYDKFYYLEGDLKGVYLITGNTHHASFILRDDSYFISCTNNIKAEEDYCTEELMKKIINSIDRL